MALWTALSAENAKSVPLNTTNTNNSIETTNKPTLINDIKGFRFVLKVTGALHVEVIEKMNYKLTQIISIIN